MLETLGIVVEDLSAAERRDLKLNGGVKIAKIYPGVIRKTTNMQEGFIISKMNNQPVVSVDDFIKMLETAEGGVMLEGFYPQDRNTTHFYAFGL